MESFDISHCNELSVSDAKEYIKKYFYPLSTGLHVQVEYDPDHKPVYEIKEAKIIKEVYFNRLQKVLQDFYFKQYDQIKTLTCELNKPFVFGKFINTCPAFMHEVKPFESFSTEAKANVKLMLDYLKEIWANGNENQYQFIIKWFANMAKGGKNQSVLYLRSEEGIGKSTFTDFLRKHVIGNKLCILSGSNPLTSQFNAILFCKLLVVFEELESFSTNQWQAVSTRIKRDTTADTCNYEDKFVKAFTARNISNYIINSNVDAIKNDEGRRYFILDLSHKRKGDIKFFDNIYKSCMNDECGDAFFSYLFSVDLTDYHDQDFPATQAKQDAIVKRLDNVSRFIKEKYILKYKDFKLNLKDAFDEYILFCVSIGGKELCKIDFNKKLDLLTIKSYKSGTDHNKFNYSHDKLVEIANINKWMHDTDQYEIKIDPFDSELDRGLDKDLATKNAEIIVLKEQIEMLTNKMKLFETINVKIEPLDVNIVEELDPVIISPVIKQDPYELILAQFKQDQENMAELTKPKPKKKKINKIQFELFLNDIDDLC